MRLSSCLLTLLCLCAGAAESIFNVKSASDLKIWKIRTNKTDTLTISERFSTVNPKSLRFTTPKYAAPMEQWPAFEAKPLIRDWSQFDRLVLDITNPNPALQKLAFFITDSKTPFRKGLSASSMLPGNFATRVVIPLSKFPDAIDRKDVAIVHFFTERPGSDMELYIGGMYLLKKGEKLPALPPDFVRNIVKLCAFQFDHVMKAAEGQIAGLDKLADTPALKFRLKHIRKQLPVAVDKLKSALYAKDMTLEELDALRSKLESLPLTVKRQPSVFNFERDFDKAGFHSPSMLVGTASSMVKILPRDMPFEANVSKSINISLAKNERECFQVLVMPRNKALKNVTVSIPSLKDDKGNILQAETAVVGFVKTEKAPPYKVSYVGWWPDPILNFMKSCDIKADELQSFWIRIHAPKDQVPGTYFGKIMVSADNVKPVEMDLNVKVRTFTLPAATPLPTAISIGRPKIMGDDAQWQKNKFAFADFLADYYMDYDHLYRQGEPDWEILMHLHKQGRLAAFNLGNVFNGGVEEKGFDQKMQKTIDRLKVSYDKAKELGILDHAYIYGFDERGKDQFPILERCAQALHKAFPDVVLMTTSYDDSFGADSVVKSIDAWCPLTPKFDVAKAENARKAGKYVWWYICCGPHNPYANWFLEYAAIESRLVMGAMPAKFRPDGFLYYATTIWNQNKGIADGPYTSWNPVSWTVYHGDGSLFHCDKDENPLPSIRLENYRDGMEDYGYACILGFRIRAMNAKQNKSAADIAWLKKAGKALEVPANLVNTMADYSHDPAVLLKWREAMAEAIDSANIPGIEQAEAGLDINVKGFSSPVFP